MMAHCSPATPESGIAPVAIPTPTISVSAPAAGATMRAMRAITDLALVPDLDHGLPGDQSTVELEHRGAEHVGAVGVAARLDIGRAGVVLDPMPDRVGHVA